MMTNLSRQKVIIGFAFLFLFFFLVSLLLYHDTLGIFFDAQEFVTFLIPLHTGQSFDSYIISGWSWHEADQRMGFFRPIISILFYLEYHLWGTARVPYRTLNVIFHSVTALIIVFLLYIIAGNRISLPVALLTGLFFLLHPTVVYSVSWISARGEILVTLFLLLSILFLTRNTHIHECDYKSLFMVLFCSICALGSKEAGIVLFIVLPLCSWGLAGRKSFGSQHFLFIGLLTLLCFLYFGVRLLLFGGIGGYGTYAPFTTYFEKTIILIKVITGLSHLSSVVFVVFISLFWIVLLLISAQASRSLFRSMSVFTICCLLAAFQHFLGSYSHHYCYMPIAFFSVIVGLSLQHLTEKRGILGMLFLTGFTFILGLLAWKNLEVNKILKDETIVMENLFQSVVEHQGKFEDGESYTILLKTENEKVEQAVKWLPQYIMFVKATSDIAFHYAETLKQTHTRKLIILGDESLSVVDKKELPKRKTLRKRKSD